MNPREPLPAWRKWALALATAALATWIVVLVILAWHSAGGPRRRPSSTIALPAPSYALVRR